MTATEARRGDVAAVLAIIKWRKEEDEEEEGVIAPLLTTVGRSWAGIAGAPSSESSPVKGAFNYGVEFVKSLARNNLPPPPPLRPPPKPVSRACGARGGSPSSLAKSHRTNERTHTHVLTHLGKKEGEKPRQRGEGGNSLLFAATTAADAAAKIPMHTEERDPGRDRPGNKMEKETIWEEV